MLSRLSIVLAVLLLAACTGDPPPPASGDPDGTSLVIAVGTAPETLDPQAGYAPYGAAQIYDGLVELSPTGARPTLAAAPPVPSADGLTWTVRLRTDVSFHDGTGLDATDVAASYQPLVGEGRFWMIERVKPVNATTVQFALSRPYPDLPSVLTLGIEPSESAGTDRTVGTGPYRVSLWDPGKRLVLTANPGYFGDRPAITEVTVEFVPDPAERAARLRDGTVDGAPLPAALAAEFDGADGMTTHTHRAADLRAITLPSGNAVTGDPAVRLALNLAVDRQAVLDTVLAGVGVPTSLPVPDVQAEFAEPAAAFAFEPATAATVLTSADWIAGDDGVRVRKGVRASFVVGYPEGDAEAEQLVTAFAQAAAQIGIEVTPRAGGENGAQYRAVGNPVDPEAALRGLLYAAGGSTAAALDQARAATDPVQAAVALHAAQRANRTSPAAVVLVQANHAYVHRDAWAGHAAVTDAPVTDHTWGAWWNLADWTPR
ncbi:ABC transporter substrate-binding protein [Actinokineospora sp. UTMC 2448]|uniref:ABC transporter substrate-binding protein n=1 Tax=Actinokineospora sp. UTMC 2448 TaxID=2268449 RepID=UPI00216429A7|nr:ABC transporter substrate-binding protein [Actinokineospora sp. UTMC 2448]